MTENTSDLGIRREKRNSETKENRRIKFNILTRTSKKRKLIKTTGHIFNSITIIKILSRMMGMSSPYKKGLRTVNEEYRVNEA